MSSPTEPKRPASAVAGPDLIGDGLRQLFKSATLEALPDELMDLLARIDAAEAETVAIPARVDRGDT